MCNKVDKSNKNQEPTSHHAFVDQFLVSDRDESGSGSDGDGSGSGGDGGWRRRSRFLAQLFLDDFDARQQSQSAIREFRKIQSTLQTLQHVY